MIKLSELKINENNPRHIKERELERLKRSIVEFEKMLAVRPLLVDRTTNIVYGGNMRLRALKELGYKEIPEEWVKDISDLSDDEKRELVIKDNLSYGEWDFDLLANSYDAEELQDWGLDVPNVELDSDDDDEGFMNFEKSVQMHPDTEYVVITAGEDNEFWDEMKEKLKLKLVRRGGYKYGSQFDTVSTERVIPFDELIKRLMEKE
jgi:hypothetical protein